VKDILPVDFANMACLNRYNIQRMSVGAKNFEFIAFMIAVNKNHDADISRSKIVLRQISRQYDPFMFSNHCQPPKDRPLSIEGGHHHMR
jgi:hypothetical protein